MTNAEFKSASFNAYLCYVAYINGEKTAAETVTALSPLMAEYGFTLTTDNLGNVLTVRMASYGKDKGEVAKKVKSITTFRTFIKGGWEEVESSPVHSNAGKAPADPTEKKQRKTMKERLEEAEALNRQLQEKLNQMNVSAEEVAA